MPRKKTQSTESQWQKAATPVLYPEALDFMEARAKAIREEDAQNLVWLLEHPPLYTAGTSAKAQDLRTPRFPVFETGRGGQYTYHGPGQRVAYVMMDLQKRGCDLRQYICDLEQWVINALACLGVKGERRDERIGIWVARDNGREEKIAAVGVRVRKWVAYHGVSINVDCDLSHYDGIVPCGISEHGVTSLRALGSDATMDDLDRALKESWA